MIIFGRGCLHDASENIREMCAVTLCAAKKKLRENSILVFKKINTRIKKKQCLLLVHGTAVEFC